MCSNAGHVLFRRGPRRRRALWRRAPQWTTTWWAPLPWGQLPRWLAEMLMAPEALQQSGVVVVGGGVVVAAGGRRAVRAGARAAWVGWVPAEGARRRRGGAGRTRSEAAGRHRRRERVWARGARGATTFTAWLFGRLLVVTKLCVCWVGCLRSLVGKSTKAQ